MSKHPHPLRFDPFVSDQPDTSDKAVQEALFDAIEDCIDTVESTSEQRTEARHALATLRARIKDDTDTIATLTRQNASLTRIVKRDMEAAAQAEAHIKQQDAVVKAAAIACIGYHLPDLAEALAALDAKEA